MNPKDASLVLGIGLTVLDEILAMIAHVKGQGSLTTEQIIAMADQQDLANKEAIKALLAL